MEKLEEPQEEITQPKTATSKVVILFRAVGNAPILKQPKVKVDEQDKFSKVLQFLKRQLSSEQVFAYLKEAFCPSPDEKIQTLYNAYAVDGKLVISYACTPAWGTSSPMQDSPERILRASCGSDDEHVQQSEALDDSIDRHDRDGDGSDDEDASDRRKPVPGSSSGPARLYVHKSAAPLAAIVQQRPPPPRPVSTAVRPPVHRQQNGTVVKGRNRYFILKSINAENIQRAVAEGIWATQRHNEPKLNEAFRNSENVYLIFSVNASGHFQGYARMTTLVGGVRGKPEGWLGNAAVGTIFGVEWRRVLDLEFKDTAPLGNNPMNEDKPVRIARDGQELPPDLGQKMTALFEDVAKKKGVARPVPPPRPPGVRAQPPPGGPPAARVRPLGMSSGPVRPDGNAIVFNEMGMPVGNLASFSMRGGMAGGMGGGMNMPGMVGMRPGMGGMGMSPMGINPMGINPMGMSMGMMDGGLGMANGGMGMMNGGPGMGMGSMPMLPSNMQSMGMQQGMNGMGRMHGNVMGMGMPMNGANVGMRTGGGMGLGTGMLADPTIPIRTGRRSPERDWRGRSRRSRSRSRSRSPRRSRRGRSRSRSRDRSGRGGSSAPRGPDLMQMSYAEYLEHFERVRQQKAAASTSVPNSQGTLQQQQQLQQQPGMRGSRGGSGQVLMTEQAYIQHCQQLAAANGTPFDLQAVRRFYHQMAAQMMQ